MPTDDERRWLADNMRTFDVVGDARGRIWLNGTLFGMDICARSEETIRNGLRRLAAFVEPEPERTCQDVEGGNFFRCSKCGCELMRFADGWKPLYMGEVRYCPNCGARVEPQ